MDAPLAVAATYFGALVGGFALVAVWETLAAARAGARSLASRWPSNFTLLAINHGVLPWITPVSNAGAAWLAGENSPRACSMPSAFPRRSLSS